MSYVSVTMTAKMIMVMIVITIRIRMIIMMMRTVVTVRAVHGVRSMSSLIKAPTYLEVINLINTYV